MKNRDKNFLSGYIGRSLTLIIALFILAVTVSALISGGGISKRTAIRFCCLETAGGPPDAHTSALREFLSGTRTVTISAVAGLDGCDLMIRPAFEWLTDSHPDKGTPIFSLETISGRNDEALLISRRNGEEGVRPRLSAAGLQFTNRYSINGFWNQLEMLREGGMHLPAELDSFRFAETDEHACERVIIAVLSGSAHVGACRRSTLRELENAGALSPEHLEILAGRPALPEMLIVSSRDKATYYRTHLDLVRASLAAEDPREAGDGPRIAIEELTLEKLDRMRAIERLIGEYRGQF